jgi:hypothetical protein
MDDDAVLRAIGKLEGQMEGIGRELGDIKIMISGNDQGLCGRLSYLEVNGAKISQENAADLVLLTGRVIHLEKAQENIVEIATEKKHWIDSAYAKVGIAMGILFGFYAAIKDFIH